MTRNIFQSALTFRLCKFEKISFVLLNQLDLALTIFAVSIGFTELNPLFRNLIGTPWQLITVKVVVPVLIAWLVPGRFLLPAIFCLFFVVGWDVKELIIGIA